MRTLAILGSTGSVGVQASAEEMIPKLLRPQPDPAAVQRLRSLPFWGEAVGSERTALRVTGISFWLLALGLAITALYNLFTGHKPETTLPGLVISLISIGAMWALVAAKRKVGRALDSAPILADANCTMVCIYMSVVLLASSLIYQLVGIGFIDSLGAVGLIYFSIREGKESFEKAEGIDNCSDDGGKGCQN